MSKKSIFSCKECGSSFPKWIGKCTACGQWDTIVEESPAKPNPYTGVVNTAIQLNEIDLGSNEERWITGVEQFDRVVGGGIVSGSVGLLGGEPGVGKSTLILQLLGRVAKLEKKALYVSGEESARQIKGRAERLKIDSPAIHVLAEYSLEKIIASTAKFDFLVVDSIQTVATDRIPGAPGSLTQVRDCASELIRFAKSAGVSVLLVGHVNKEGYVAGPKTLEHMVDYVIYLEAGTNPMFRFIYANKNRFGAVNETGVFKMTPGGLAEITDPNRYLASTVDLKQPGVSYFMSEEGSRCLLLEVQSLVSDQARNNPQRQTNGIDRNRLTMLVAVIEKHLGIPLGGSDIYVNVSGGFKSADPSADMAIMAAILSGFYRAIWRKPTLFVGEISLTGRFGLYYDPNERIKEASGLGFDQILVPFNPESKAKPWSLKNNESENIQRIESVSDFLEYFNANTDKIPLLRPLK